MKMKFSTVLTTIEGEPIVVIETGPNGIAQTVIDKTTNKPKRLTAWDVARTCLTSELRAEAPSNPHERELPVDGQEKFTRVDLARRILDAHRRGEDAEITTDEGSLLKKICGRMYTSNAAYAFYRFIEGKEQCQAIGGDSDKVVAIGAATQTGQLPGGAAASG